ncbi:MAG: PIN domain-containing protein [Candidatus Kapabacteria bacterium]|jgi:predicted nucleic acid-binding protein|nr:PIN domain-containing protein [Candidatus Kapabacteria bacterium]
MRIVIDTNIIFSAILNTNSKIGKIVIQKGNNFNFYGTNQIVLEIDKHKNKLKKLTKYNETELDIIIDSIKRRIKFINVKLISKDSYRYAESLTHDIDIDDTEFVALTEHINGNLWTGDKELKNGLLNKGWTKFVTTDELYQILLNRK